MSTRAPIALAALLSLASPAPARAAEPARIAFLCLHPAEDAAFQGTAIVQLAEAQRLRVVAENVVEMLSGASVLRHEELRAALGPRYLVDVFDCRGEVACQLRVAAGLRRRGVSAAVVGDYFAEGEVLRLRLRRLDLARGRIADETSFSLARADAETLGPWRAALETWFLDTGSLRIVTNVAGPACTLDGKPCALSGDGVVLDVPEGEHLLELAREGYRRAHRVVTVKRREELRVAVPLEELPVQAQKAPDPNARVPTFEPPGETTRIAPFGLLRLAVGYDDVNGGDREEPTVPPRAAAGREGGLVVLPRPAIAGVTVQAPRRESGWQLRGAFSSAWVKDEVPEIDSAYAELVREDSGFRLMLGLGQGVVSSLTAGTLTLPEGFGDLSAAFVGITVSQSVGPFVLEGFVGRHKGQFSPEAVPDGASPSPFGAARVAFVSEAIMGRLYGEDYPLTIGVSAIRGEERVTFDVDPADAVPPVRQQVPVWVASLEIHLPFGRVAGLAGEAYVGEDAHLLEGALWQGPRVDPATGLHRALRSAGGWLQLSVAAGALEVRLVGGMDRILDGLDFGVAPDGAPAIRENRLAAVDAVFYLLDHLALGLQLHAVRTTYADPDLGSPELHGVVFTSQLKF